MALIEFNGVAAQDRNRNDTVGALLVRPVKWNAILYIISAIDSTFYKEGKLQF